MWQQVKKKVEIAKQKKKEKEERQKLVEKKKQPAAFFSIPLLNVSLQEVDFKLEPLFYPHVKYPASPSPISNYNEYFEDSVIKKFSNSKWRQMKHFIKKCVSDENLLIERNKFKLTVVDIKTLAGTHWVNDQIINFYFKLIEERNLNSTYLPDIFAFSSFFFGSLKQHGYEGVKRETKNIDIFKYSIIFIPVFELNHWTLIIVDFGECKIISYDSIGGKNIDNTKEMIKYMKQEYLEKKKEKKSFDYLAFEYVTCPHQTNSYDCGVFISYFAKCYGMLKSPSFVQKELKLIRTMMTYEILNSQILE
ncbi:hypothetical protein PVAND_001296 [Polypedilum vanderplanki]|uniref:Ubiquitin-like protease family profile domain-containing protein n=1 Tax=Polypedilum vanderplanki TaxID=319348 RepID=A0A9J6BMT1_POLVA|nr:hypothetical protein PVAND_001296 [Polypedilum vanderplanki]